MPAPSHTVARRMAHELTAKQSLTLDFIASHIVKNQRPPTRFEISAHFGWASVNAAECAIEALERKGHIVRDGSSAGNQWARYPRIVRWPASVLPVLCLASPGAGLTD